MATVQIVEKHNLTQDEAKKRLAALEEQLTKFHMKAHWNGHNAELKGTGASGSITVSAADVKIEVKLGLLAKAAGIKPEQVDSSVRKRVRAALDGVPV